MKLISLLSLDLAELDSTTGALRTERKMTSVPRSSASIFAFGIIGLLAACSNPGPVNHPNYPPAKPAGQSALPPPSGTASGVPGVSETLAESDVGKPTILPGTGIMLGDQGGQDGQPSLAKAGDITLNFVDTDVREVVRSVLGDVLHLNYSIDSKVQATVTVQTSRPLQRDQVLPTLQEVLRTSGLALVESGGVYRVVPIDEAARSGAGSLVLGRGATRIGNATYNVQIFPLKYASAAEMQRTIEPLLPKGAFIQVDTTRNLLIISGTGQDLSTATELVRTFDVDYLSGMSFGIFPLKIGTPKAVVGELNGIFGQGGSVPLSGILRFAPLDRMNAVLVVSPQRAYLEQARAWIERLDLGSDENTPRLYEYHVQNSRAADLAKVLSQLFAGSVRTVDTQANASSSQTSPTGTSAMGFGGASSLGAGNSQLGGGASPLGGAGSPLGGGALPLGGGASPLGGGGLGGSTIGQGGLGATPSTPSAGTTTLQSGTGDNSGRSAPPSPPGLADALGDAFSSDKAASGGQGGFELPQVRIVADEKNNALVIFARPRQYRMIEETLQRLDVVPVQVLIEATIAEVTLNDSLQYGLQWFFQKGATSFANNASTTATTTPAIQPGFNFQFLQGTGINVILSALSAVTDVNVVSSPQLLVLDHHQATLQVGDQVPVPSGQSQSTLTAGAPIVNTIQYLSTGVILHVSPRVNSNGVITLDIVQEVSNVVAGAVNAALNNAPTINQRHVDTTVSVLDGETVALGGLIQDQTTLGNSGIPLLSNIPVVGALFSSKNDAKTRTELLILLSPRVLHDPREARSVTDELRSRLHTIDSVFDRAH